MTYGFEAKHTHLGAALWLEDTLNKEEAYDNTNNAYIIRKNWVFNNNGLLYFSTPLHVDFFNSQRYLNHRGKHQQKNCIFFFQNLPDILMLNQTFYGICK